MRPLNIQMLVVWAMVNLPPSLSIFTLIYITVHIVA